MTADTVELRGPDLAAGVPQTRIPEGELFRAHAFGKPLVVVRRGSVVDVIGAQCTHYGGPLTEGLLVADTVRCPWHHARFSLRTDEATRAPALKPVATWTTEQRDGRDFVTGDVEPGDGATPEPDRAAAPATQASVVIVGGGASVAVLTVGRNGASLRAELAQQNAPHHARKRP